MMHPIARVILALTLMVPGITLPALADGQYIFDTTGLLTNATIEHLNESIGAFEATTSKEIVVDIVPSTDGLTPRAAAQRDFALHRVNGVMIFIAKEPKTIGILGDRVSHLVFSRSDLDDIRTAITASFRSGRYDDGVTTGVRLLMDGYRNHAQSLRRPAPVGFRSHAAMYGYGEQHGDGGRWIWILLGIVAVFFIIRAITRASSNSTMPYGGGYGGPTGYGGGYPMGGGYGGGWGGGGGGFFSSLLGGLGGAFLGNELFSAFNRPNEPNVYEQSGQTIDSQPVDDGSFQADAGQADLDNGSFGDWGGSGDSGGGGDWGGGGDNGGGW